MSRLAAVLVLALVGCSQSRHDGLQAVCDSWSQCEECRTTTPDRRAAVLGAHLEADVSNDEAMELLRSTRDLPPTERAARLREAAAAEDIASCASADAIATW